MGQVNCITCPVDMNKGLLIKNFLWAPLGGILAGGKWDPGPSGILFFYFFISTCIGPSVYI